MKTFILLFLLFIVSCRPVCDHKNDKEDVVYINCKQEELNKWFTECLITKNGLTVHGCHHYSKELFCDKQTNK